ncbi:MAG: hypothetical protein ACOCQD_03715 [archaeon]
MFQGFSTIQFPVFEVKTPQTGHSFSLRSLNVSELNKLKNSITVPTTANKVIANLLWETIEEKPKYINTYEDFINMTTILDREALLQGLHVSSFGEEREIRLTCPNKECKNSQLTKLNLANMITYNFYPGAQSILNTYRVMKTQGEVDYDEEIESRLAKFKKPPEGMPKSIARAEYPEYFEELDRIEEEKYKERIEDKNNTEYEDIISEEDGITVFKNVEKKNTEEKSSSKKKAEIVKEDEKKNEAPPKSILDEIIEISLPRCSNIVAHIKQPTIADEINATNELLVDENIGQLVYESMVVRDFKEYDKSGKLIQTVEGYLDVFEAYQALLPDDKNEILETYNTNFGQYETSLKTEWTCGKCGKVSPVELDIHNEFFRMVGRS